MEELFVLISSQNIHLDSFDIPEEYMEGDGKEIVKDFHFFCTSKL